MREFNKVKNHERFIEPINVGDMNVQEKLYKYIKARNELVENRKYSNEILEQLEPLYFLDDFEYWWYKVDRSYINNVIKIFKSKSKVMKA